LAEFNIIQEDNGLSFLPFHQVLLG